LARLRIEMTLSGERSLLMTTVAQLAEAMQTLLTTTAETTARATGFVQRRSKLGGAAFVQALVFAWLANPQATVEARAQAAAVAGVAISPQGREQRCTERAAVFLEQLLAAAVRTVIAAEPVVLPLLQRFSAVVLLDSSTVCQTSIRIAGGVAENFR